ncbi:serine hydrolase domain-containing protein [Paenibacillus massiliensis]|uniref:serine hydrolase domain-containing protein n=1 Tax=Paenibacillus massiliensis TaxID=225917 RepID=UPI00046F14DB|nr:serine hydrolase [Paenibacillus massiliensis]
MTQITSTTINTLTLKLHETMERVDFSGALLLHSKDSTPLLTTTRGKANRAEDLPIQLDTRFGIASGCKVFTAVSICQLVEQGKLSLDTRLKDCLSVDFPLWDAGITIRQLLTHTAGIPDYFDEEVMDDFEELWKQRPVYGLRKLRDFLPMFSEAPMKFQPGERFHYNNAGFIVLGLIVEQQTGSSFTDYVERHIFAPSGMSSSGYFAMDNLPRHTALGYIQNDDGSWRTNIFSVPVKGGADGGAYVTAPDMLSFWNALMSGKLLGHELLQQLLTPHVHEQDESYYGYGIWIEQQEKEIRKYHLMGFDPGVSFVSAVYPQHDLKLVITSNQSRGPYPIMKTIEEILRL